VLLFPEQSLVGELLVGRLSSRLLVEEVSEVSEVVVVAEKPPAVAVGWVVDGLEAAAENCANEAELL